jgi:hypothetical protein
MPKARRGRKPLTPLAVSYHLVEVTALSIIHMMMGR